MRHCLSKKHLSFALIFFLNRHFVGILFPLNCTRGRAAISERDPMGLFSELYHKYIGLLKKWAKIGWKVSVCACVFVLLRLPLRCVCVCVCLILKREKRAPFTNLYLEDLKINAGSFFWQFHFRVHFSRRHVCDLIYLECAFLCNMSASLLIRYKHWFQSTQSTESVSPWVSRDTVVCNW